MDLDGSGANRVARNRECDRPVGVHRSLPTANGKRRTAIARRRRAAWFAYRLSHITAACAVVVPLPAPTTAFTPRLLPQGNPGGQERASVPVASAPAPYSSIVSICRTSTPSSGSPGDGRPLMNTHVVGPI